MKETAIIKQFYSFVSLQVMGGGKALSVASVTLKNSKGEISEADIGNNSVDAIFNCINRLIGCSAKLLNHKVEADAVKKGAIKALVKIKIGSSIHYGKGMGTDLLEASARAYVNAFNQFFITANNKVVVQ